MPTRDKVNELAPTRPKLKTLRAWEQAQQLMQPAYIRAIDNIRKRSEASAWQESYRPVDAPIPGHLLCLSLGDRSVEVNLWELCFRICFESYDPDRANHQGDVDVEIDANLFDPETGDVDWECLDEKAKQQVEAIFAALP